MYFRTYEVEYLKQIDFDDDEKLKFEAHILAAEKKKDKKHKNKEKIEKVA